MNKGTLSNLFRSLGLMHLIDNIRYFYYKNKNKKANQEFKNKYPNIKLPPDYLIYESFQINYNEYYTKSRESAQWLIDNFRKHIPLESGNILDWGCGPGRIIRHFPELLGEKFNIYGTDYNERSIDWCKNNLENINFNHNGLEANLPYNENHFDVIFAISIFTHLSEEKHYEWFNELLRTMKPGGIFFFSTHGNAFFNKLSETEKRKFKNGEIIERGSVTEGHRVYTAFHPDAFMHKLLKDVKILEHVEQPEPTTGKHQQDIWIIQKPE
ncbi:MAG: class I SAM-dependent methyltransferase [Bacteroidales bacterium]|nr:class I SAM-dependent methyltransferase [Bacteroidales bacterium]